MKPKKINYKIEEPCHADWDQMKPEVQGRFCSSCSKTVVDFSTMSDFSIVNYLENNKHQSVCGRFAEDQLAKTYFLPKRNQSSFQFDLRAVALGLALSTFSALPSHAQTSVQVEQRDTAVTEPVVVKQGKIAMTYDHKDESVVSGKVTLEGKENQTIRIGLMDGNSKELSFIETSKNGTFSVPLDWAKNPVSIRVTASGHSSQTIYFENHESLKDLTITLYELRKMVKGKVMRTDH